MKASRFPRLALVVASSSPAVCPCVWAQDQVSATASDSVVEEIVVSASASRLPENLGSFPGSVQMVGRDVIEQLRATNSDVGTLLGYAVPGLAAGTQGNSSNFDQSMRGRIPAVLIDGVPIGTPLRDGRRDIRSISMAAVERVEVIRGSSALYGNGGAGGVINYITRVARRGERTFGADIGLTSSLTHSSDSAAPSAELFGTATWGLLDFTGSFYHEQTSGQFDAEGDRIRPDPNNQGGTSDSDIWNAFAKVGATFDEQRIELSVLSYDQSQHSDYNGTTNGSVAAGIKTVPFKAPLDPRAMKEGNENLLATLAYSHANVLGSRLSAQVFHQEYENVFGFTLPSSGIPAGGSSLVYSEKRGARLDMNTPLPLGRQSNLLWGVDFVDDSTGQDVVNLQLSEPSRRRVWAPEVTQQSLAGFLQANVGVTDRLTFRGGARYEDIDVSWDAFNVIANGTVDSPAPGPAIPGGNPSYSATTFNGGVSFALTQSLNLFAAYSEGYSVAEIGRLLRQATTANQVLRANLEASIVESYEIGARFDGGKLSAQLTVFEAESNLGTTIVPTSSTTFGIVRSPEETYGAELAVDATPLNVLRLGASVTYVDGKRDSNNDGRLDRKLPSNRTPPMKYTAYVDYAWNPWISSRVQALHSADRDPFDTITLLGEGPVESYTLVDLSTTVDLQARGVISIGIGNLFNEDYFTVASQLLRLDHGFSKGPGTTAKITYSIRF